MLIAQAIVGVIHFTFHLTAFVDGPEATRQGFSGNRSLNLSATRTKSYAET
jgi:hypothetical protein